LGLGVRADKVSQCLAGSRASRRPVHCRAVSSLVPHSGTEQVGVITPGSLGGWKDVVLARFVNYALACVFVLASSLNYASDAGD